MAYESIGVLAGVLILSAVGGALARWMRLPVITGYILVGVMVGWIGWAANPGVRNLLGLMGQMGVMFLLFLVGLELPVSQVKKMGRAALLSGVGQIAVTSGLGFFLSRLLGFGIAAALYLGVALTFSSTIIIVKLLSEKRELNSLHGRIAVGSLLVQDFVAIGILIVLSGVGRFDGVGVAALLIKGTAAVAIGLGLADKVLPWVARKLSTSVEVLFIFSIAWCLAVAWVAASKWVGLSLEIGGFLAGLSLAHAAAHFQITARIRPLRDFFLTLFFVVLGTQVSLESLGSVWWPAMVLALYVMVGNPLIMVWVLTGLGYGKRTAFLAGITMGQISEFSLVVVAAAVAAGQVPREVIGVVTVVGLVTMTTGSYVVANSEKVYRRISKYLPVWPGKGKKQSPLELSGEELVGHAILFGHSRTGSSLGKSLATFGRLVVVDFDPVVVEKAKSEGLDAIFGDMSDPELYESLGLDRASVVVSTVPDLSDTLQLLRVLRPEGKRGGKKQLVIVTAVDSGDAKELYRAGADYVLVPHSVGGDFLAQILDRHKRDMEYVVNYGKLHWNWLVANAV